MSDSESDDENIANAESDDEEIIVFPSTYNRDTSNRPVTFPQPFTLLCPTVSSTCVAPSTSIRPLVSLVASPVLPPVLPPYLVSLVTYNRDTWSLCS
jgi:hypothetical protein